MKIIIDVWGGERSQEWVARYVRDPETSYDLALEELKLGNLVNLRHEADYGEYEEFDNRKNGVN